MIPLSIFLIFIPIGLGVGIFATMTGLGGGVLMVPIMVYGIFSLVDFIDPNYLDFVYATTISSAVIIFLGISGTIAFSRQKKIDYLIGIISAIFSIGGAFLGKFTQIVGKDIVAIIFSILLILASIQIMIKAISVYIPKNKKIPKNNNKIDQSNEKLSEEKNVKIKKLNIFDKLTLNRHIIDNKGQIYDYKARFYLVPLTFIGGYVAGIAGIGGGIVMVPLFTILMGLPIHFATATSTFVMIFSSLASVIYAYINSYTSGIIITEGIWWPFIVGLVIGIIPGTQLGAFFAKRIKADTLRLTFGIILFGISIWTIIKTLLDL